MKVFYDWAAKGSRLFLSDSGLETSSISSALRDGLKLYERLGQPFITRSVDRLKELIQPWKVVEPGFSSLEEWVGVTAGVAEAPLSSFGFSALGAILEK